MGIVFGLCCLLLSPILLFTYAVIKQLKALHEELRHTGRPRADSLPLSVPDTLMRSADSRK